MFFNGMWYNINNSKNIFFWRHTSKRYYRYTSILDASEVSKLNKGKFQNWTKENNLFKLVCSRHNHDQFLELVEGENNG